MKSQLFPASGLQNHEIRHQDAKKYDSAHNENRGYQHSGKSSLDGVTLESRMRQTAPCKHFTRTGHCPLGDACHFIHDLSLGMLDKGKGIQVEPHCWAHVQGGCCVRPCQYFHPYDIRPYQKYTPCYAWNLCPNQPTCPFKHPEQILPPTEVEVSSTPPVQMNGMGRGPLHPNTQDRTPGSDPRVPSSAYDYRGIYAPPSHADHPVRIGLTHPMAPLDALPGPSFEDSPPQPLASRSYRKIYESRPDDDASLPPPQVHRSYPPEYGISYYPPHQSMAPAQRRFDGAPKEIRISGLDRLGQRGPSGPDRNRDDYSLWVAQLQEEVRRKPLIRRQV